MNDKYISDKAFREIVIDKAKELKKLVEESLKEYETNFNNGIIPDDYTIPLQRLLTKYEDKSEYDYVKYAEEFTDRVCLKMLDSYLTVQKRRFKEKTGQMAVVNHYYLCVKGAKKKEE